MKWSPLVFWNEGTKPNINKFIFSITLINFIIAAFVYYYSQSNIVIQLGKIAQTLVNSDLTKYSSISANAYHVISWITFILSLPKIWMLVKNYSDGGNFLQRLFMLAIWLIVIYELYISKNNDFHSHTLFNWMFLLVTNNSLFPYGSILTTSFLFALGAIISSVLQKIIYK